MKKLTLVFVTFAICSAFLACSPQRYTPPPMYVHTVSVSGETLSLIADWYTGSSQNWRTIADNNPGLNPNRLRLGDQIAIPESMTIRTEPLTRRYVEGSTRRPSGSGETFARTTAPETSPKNAHEPSVAEGQGASDIAALAPSEAAPTTDTAVSASPPLAAEGAATEAGQAVAEVDKSVQDASAKIVESAANDSNNEQINEAAKQAKADAEEAVRRANAAATEASNKATESAKNVVEQASSGTGTNVANSDAAPASDRPKSKDELLKELLEDK